MTRKEIRIAKGYSRIRVAAWAGVSEPTARVYEISPEEIGDPAKRKALDAVYATMQSELRAALATMEDLPEVKQKKATRSKVTEPLEPDELMERRVLDAVRKNAGLKSRNQIVNNCAGTKPAILSAINRLIDAGRLVCTREGHRIVDGSAAPGTDETEARQCAMIESDYANPDARLR